MAKTKKLNGAFYRSCVMGTKTVVSSNSGVLFPDYDLQEATALLLTSEIEAVYHCILGNQNGGWWIILTLDGFGKIQTKTVTAAQLIDA